MSEHLHVLLVENEPGAAELAEAELVAAGCKVSRCHEPGAAAFPCNALLDDRGCPLEGEPIDVAIDVRRRPRAKPSAFEDGVSCALRQHIPTVIAGPAVLNPYTVHATKLLNRTYDVVGDVEAAARAPLPRHTAAAAAALREMLGRRGITAEPKVSVTRRAGALLISVGDLGELDTPTRSMAAVRMTGAVRAIDTHARGVDVVFDGRV